MRIKLSPMGNLDAGFTLRCCKGCGKAIAHYDPDYVVIDEKYVFHDVCLIAAIESIPVKGKEDVPAFHPGRMLTNGGQGWPTPTDAATLRMMSCIGQPNEAEITIGLNDHTEKKFHVKTAGPGNQLP